MTVMSADGCRMLIEGLIARAESTSYITRDEGLLLNTVSALQQAISTSEHVKLHAIEAANESLANEILSWTVLLSGHTLGLKMWIALRRGQPNEAWEHCVEAETAFRMAARVHEWGLRWGAAESAERMVNIQETVFPLQQFVSVGALAKESRCSICKEISGECQHVPGSAYMGQLAIRVVVEAELREVSLVDRPALKSARVRQVAIDGQWIDTMTLIPQGPAPDSTSAFKAWIPQAHRTDGPEIVEIEKSLP
jgi:hypothetical protein